MLLLIDNYDSFTFNLYQYLSELGQQVKVARNDKISLQEIKILSPERIVISPGPGTPENAGISNNVILEFGETIPILGVCLGHQCIAHCYGGGIAKAGEIKHGKSSRFLSWNDNCSSLGQCSEVRVSAELLRPFAPPGFPLSVPERREGARTHSIHAGGDASHFD